MNSTLEEVESTRTIFLYLLIRNGISSHFERHAKTSCTCGIFRFVGISLFPPTPMRCAIRRGKSLYGSYDNNSLLACSPYMASEASREGTREKTLSSDLSRAALACLLAIPPNGCAQAMIMRMISFFTARVSIRKLWQLLPPLIIVLTAPVHPMVSKPCRQSAVQWSYTEVESLCVSRAMIILL